MTETPSSTPGADVLSDVLRDYMNVAQQLQSTHETLQREVTRLREELASKDRELERRRRLAALGELAAGVAHEVRNPLGAIQLYSGLLRSKVKGSDLEAALQLIEKIESGVEAIDGVVRDTLALAPRNGRVSACEVAALIERARDVSMSVLEKQQITLTTRVEHSAAAVQGHPDGLQRVFVNLICNAAEASPPGAEVSVTVAEGPDETVEVRVTDSGVGLPDEVLHRIFDPFFTTKEHGTGLGLTIAHRLVEAHGGVLAAHNREPHGAEFVVTLPSASANGKNCGSEFDQHVSVA